jgi:hypothetical protein
MIEKDSILTGIVLGCIVPVLGYLGLEFIFELLTKFGLMEAVSSSTSGRRFRTLTLLAICTSLIPFNVAKTNRYDATMRGIVFPTLIYVAAWVYKFYNELFG